MPAFTIDGDWTWDVTNNFTVQAPGGTMGFLITPTLGILGFGEGTGFTVLSNGNCEIGANQFNVYAGSALNIFSQGGASYRDSVSLNLDSVSLTIAQSLATSLVFGNNSCALTGAFSTVTMASQSGASYTDATTITLDTPDLLIGLTSCTNLGIGNGNTGIYVSCNLLQMSSAGPINLSGSTGSSYTDAVSLTLDSVSLNIGESLCTNFSLGNNAAPVTFLANNWNVQSNGNQFIFADSSGNSTFGSNAASTSTVINGQTVAISSLGNININAAAGQAIYYNLANAADTNFFGRNVFFDISGGLSCTTNGADMIFSTAAYNIYFDSFSNTNQSINFAQRYPGQNVNIGGTILNVGQGSTTTNIVGSNLNIGSGFSLIKILLQTPAGSNNTPLLIDTDGTIHV